MKNIKEENQSNRNIFSYAEVLFGSWDVRFGNRTLGIGDGKIVNIDNKES